MGVRTICEHGYYVMGCRCIDRHTVDVVRCDVDHSKLKARPVSPDEVLNPEVVHAIWSERE